MLKFLVPSVLGKKNAGGGVKQVPCPVCLDALPDVQIIL